LGRLKPAPTKEALITRASISPPPAGWPIAWAGNCGGAVKLPFTGSYKAAVCISASIVPPVANGLGEVEDPGLLSISLQVFFIQKAAFLALAEVFLFKSALGAGYKADFHA